MPRKNSVFYWVPTSPNIGAPESVAAMIWKELPDIASSLSIDVHSFSNATDLFALRREHGIPAVVHIGKAPVLSLNSRARALAAAAGMRTSLSTHLHGDQRRELGYLFRRNPAKAALYAPFLLSSLYLADKIYDNIFVNSHAMASLLVSAGVEKVKIQVIPNPVDVGFWQERADSYPEIRAVGGEYVFSHGRLAHEKGYDLLIKAAAVAGARDAIVLAGAGCIAPRLAKLAARLGVKLLLIGQQSPVQLRAWLRRARVAIYPSRFESFSLAALEAMLAAPAVLVSTNVGILDALPSDVVDRISVEPRVDAIASKLSIKQEGPMGMERVVAVFSPRNVARRLLGTLAEKCSAVSRE